MASWDEMTDAEKDEANQAAWDACADLLRRARDANPGREPAEYRDAVGAQIASDIAENRRVIVRASQSRATKADKRWAESARASNASLGAQLDILWDVEF